MIILLVVFLAVLELFANIWLYNFYRCDFEDNELFKNTDKESLRKICLENIGLASADDSLDWIMGTRGTGGIDENIVYINSEGFRGSEFTKEKPENTIRIFTMGGSTTFGAGVLDHQTFPFQLQKLFDNANLDFKVEVINAGWPSMYSKHETTLIKERLLEFSPDLFLVFDGANDSGSLAKKKNPEASPESWSQRWTEICKLGKNYGFDTIIAIQPSIAFGNKVPTPQEEKFKIRFLKTEHGRSIINSYPLYLEKLNELKNYCSLTTDMTGIFDHIEGPIYYDWIHTGFTGNKIIAETFYDLSFPIVMERSKKIGFDNDDGMQSLKLETDEPQVSSDMDYFLEESFIVLRDIVSPYKTPKVLPLFFGE